MDPDNPQRVPGEGPYINLNVRLFLTDIGEEKHGKAEAVRKTVAHDGSTGSAIEGDRLFARTLKEFIISRKVNRIELERMELVSRRHEITDLTKLILFSLLYRIFPRNMARVIADRKLEAAGRADEQQIHDWKRSVLDRSLEGVDPISRERDPKLEIKALKSIAGRLITTLPADYYDYFIGRAEEMTDLTADVVREYLERSRISDHLSAAFLEWVNFADRLNLERAFSLYREENHTGDADTMDAFLRLDPGNKALLEQRIARDRISLKINWKFGKEKQSNGEEESAVVRLRLINKGLIGDGMRAMIENFLNADTRGHHAGEFDHEGGAPTGFLFTSFLRETCRRLGIELFVKTREDRAGESTTMTLTLKLNPVGS